MIRNERQYKITKSQAEGFRRSYDQLQNATVSDTQSAEYLRWKIQRDAVASQLEELDEDIREYEALQGDTATPIEIGSIDEFPRILIQGRIAAGLTQRALATKLGLKEQQIQRYESTDYQGASFDRIQQIVKALGLRVRQEVFFPDVPITAESIVQKLGELGLERNFVVNRMIPERLRTAMERGESTNAQENLAIQWAGSIARVFRIDAQTLLSAAPLQINESALAAGRFKLPANYSKAKFAAYTVYAHYLALLVLHATKYGELSLTSIIGYCWDMGIPILPLSDPGVFHGATWRVQFRNVVVVKQRTTSEARWMTDILHELWHAAQSPELPESGVIELDPRSEAYTQSVDEEIATDFAADVLLNGKAEELAEECAAVCNRRMEWLKNAVQKVATRNAVREDVLANYLAYRVKMEGQDWWATATSMQRTRQDAWQLVREPILLRTDWNRLSPPDRELLQKSLQPKE